MKANLPKVPALILAASLALACGIGTAGSASNRDAEVLDRGAEAEMEKDRTLKSGAWGGDHISAQVDEKGVTIELDCADARIEGPVKLDRKGAFSVEGTITTQRPGPIREDRPNKPQRARFSGTVTGESMTLSITIIETKSDAGTFTLHFGRSGRVFRCY